MTLWGGRFTGNLDPAAWNLNASLGVDKRLALQDVRGSLAWGRALAAAGVLSTEESVQIDQGLQIIKQELQSGAFAFQGPYQAKLKGKACAELFDAQMHGSVVDRMQLEADLRRAVEHGDEFELYYQPIVALRTGTLVGIEALLRWKHPGRGLPDAADFVPLAEESGTIVPLGTWSIAGACEQLRDWQARFPSLANVTMSVNVSGRQFRRPDCVEAIRGVVKNAHIDPRHLAVEVTESVVMDDVEASAAKLGLLRDMGIQIHVDDFGTGYSSLSYLHRIPITAVKIDGSFVAGLPAHAESEEVVKAIVSIAESLDFDVIAEGIEQQPQVACLEHLRCRYGQGFHLCRPLDAAAFEAWLLGRARSVA